MRFECDVIEDLLPLYRDGACSEASTRAVEEHIKECSKCAKILEELKDTEIDELIVREKDNIIGSQSKYFRRKSAIAGIVVAAIFALPILICLIVNLASGHGLTWFFIVLASMMIPTSLFVVPLMAPKNRMFWTMISFTASIILLLAVCCIYSRGNWFFVAASSVLFGLCMCFMPFIGDDVSSVITYIEVYDFVAEIAFILWHIIYSCLGGAIFIFPTFKSVFN